MARAQGQSGISATTIWLIVFVALWLTFAVLLVVLYIDQEDKDRSVEEAKTQLAKVISSQGKKLPQFTKAKPGNGNTMVDLLETARGDAAEQLTGNRDDDVATMQSKFDETLEMIRGNRYVQQKDPSGFEGVSCIEALNNMYELFRSTAEEIGRASCRERV